jgi:hypothetical protein
VPPSTGTLPFVLALGRARRRALLLLNHAAAGIVFVHFSLLLYSFERGDGDNQLYEITEDEANQIAERIRRTVTGDQ